MHVLNLHYKYENALSEFKVNHHTHTEPNVFSDVPMRALVC